MLLGRAGMTVSVRHARIAGCRGHGLGGDCILCMEGASMHRGVVGAEQIPVRKESVVVGSSGAIYSQRSSMLREHRSLLLDEHYCLMVDTPSVRSGHGGEINDHCHC